MNVTEENVELYSQMDALIDKLLRGEANISEISLVEEWVETDESHRRFFENKRTLQAACDPPFSDTDINIDKALRKVHRQMRVRKFRRLTWMSAAAVAAVLCVSVTLAVMLGKKEPTPERFISLSSPYGAKVEAELPDGSHVWLNSNTRLEYPEAFDGDRRRVSLDGEAYFEVHADKEHPFVVKAGDMEVCATGTAFNVNSYGGKYLNVMLATGVVDVTTAESAHIKLAPEDNLHIGSDGIRVIHHADIGKYCGWKDGRICFDNDNLPSVLARLSQIYPVEFVIVDSTLVNARFHVTFVNEGLNDILHLLEVGIPMRCVHRPDGDSSGNAVYDVYAVRK